MDKQDGCAVIHGSSWVFSTFSEIVKMEDFHLRIPIFLPNPLYMRRNTVKIPQIVKEFPAFLQQPHVVSRC